MSVSKRDGRSLRAARWALENRQTLRKASVVFDCAIGTVSQTWARVYPGVPALVSRRGRPVESWPEDDVTL